MGGVAVIIVAGGRGARAGGETPKQYRALAGVPVLRRTAGAFARRPEVRALVVVRAPEHADLCAAALQGLEPAPRVVDGGASRTASVRAGMEHLAPLKPDAVLIHDAARPFVSGAVIDRVEAALLSSDGAAPALRVPDALKQLETDGSAGDDAPRDALRAVQTPQGFRYAPLLAAFRALSIGADLPDDVAVARRAKIAVALVEGDPANFKITYTEDFARAERLLASAPRVAVGSGFDAHRIGPGDEVTLCGVRIAADFGLVGHSDADVGLHALTDAILGALADGDIGTHFPPSDPAWKGADSRTFLAHAAALAGAAGATIAHADVTLICERPKVGPHRDAMRAAIADTLGLSLTHVSVKATTTERLGFAGRGEGIAAMATATLAFGERS